MNMELIAARARAMATYNAASDHFDDPEAAFWARCGRRTIEHLAPARGARILDVGCGTGASALPAAEAVGPEGCVIGVDLAEDMLARARAKASLWGLTNTEFRIGDMTGLDFPDASFDAVVSVFSVFFVPDMAAQVAELWRLVRPGGALAVTTWGSNSFEPGHSTFWDAVGIVRPDLVSTTIPWERLADPESLSALFQAGGATAPSVAAEPSTQRLNAPEDWWTIALGSGFRWTIDRMTPAEADAVRAENLRRLRLRDARGIETNAVYAIARKPE